MNRKHYEKLLEGVQAWNKWREEKPAIEPNLRGADLGIAELTAADLIEADLSGAKLGGADLKAANLRGADLIEADLSFANLSFAYLMEANLSGADLAEADLRLAKLTEAKLTEANLSGADLREADLGGADLKGADLTEANLGGANLRGAYLMEADLGGANLKRANLTIADLRKAKLGAANLTEANLGEANLTEADLTGANLTACNFSQADISGACLDDANTSRWNIAGIICTHLITGQDKKRIDYASNEFEQKHAYLGNLSDIVLNLPLSELTHHIVKMTVSVLNQCNPDNPIILKRLEALSDRNTKAVFMSFTSDDSEVGKTQEQLNRIELNVNELLSDMEEDVRQFVQDERQPKAPFGVPEEISITPYFVARPKEIKRILGKVGQVIQVAMSKDKREEKNG